MMTVSKISKIVGGTLLLLALCVSYLYADTISVSGTMTNILTGDRVAGAVLRVVEYPAITATTASDGTFTLSGLPSGQDFHVNFTASGFENQYGGYVNLTSNITGSQWGLFPAGWISTTMGNSAGKGIIAARTTASGGYSVHIAGAALTATNQLIQSFAVSYPNGSAYTGIDGFAWVKNVTPGDTVTVAASKTGISFASHAFPIHADSVSVGNIFGTSSPSNTVWLTGFTRDASANVNAGGATIQLVSDPTKTATSGPDGSFTLTGLPTTAPLEFKVTKSGYTPSYIFTPQMGVNVYRPYTSFGVLYPPVQLSGWGQVTGKGMIAARISYSSNPNYNVSGVTVTATGSTHGPYTVYYDDGTGNPAVATPLTATTAVGRFFVFNIDPSDTVTITATRSGFSYTPMTVTPPSDGVTSFTFPGTATAYVSGSVRDMTGIGVGGALVAVKDSNGSPVGAMLTPFDGTFYMGLGALDAYTITASKPGYDSPLPQTFTLSTLNQNYAVGSLLLDLDPISFNLVSGWNFITLPVQPDDATPTGLLSSIIGSVRIVWGWDGLTQQWLKFVPGDQHNSLTVMNSGKGYWIYMSQSETLPLTGTVPYNSVTLYDGWNLIGYNGSQTTLSDAVSAISAKWTQIWNWESGNWSFAHNPTISFPVTPLTALSSGKAYWIRIKTGQGGLWNQ
jgi:hypothetical protein